MANQETNRRAGRLVHDMGGLPAGRIEMGEHDTALWEKRVDALLVLLSDGKRDLVRVDELRRGIEELGAAAYEELAYYERWIHSITAALLQRGVLSTDELGRKMAEIETRMAADP